MIEIFMQQLNGVDKVDKKSHFIIKIHLNWNFSRNLNINLI